MSFCSARSGMKFKNSVCLIIRARIEDCLRKNVKVLIQGIQGLISILKDILIPILFQEI